MHAKIAGKPNSCPDKYGCDVAFRPSQHPLPVRSTPYWLAGMLACRFRVRESSTATFVDVSLSFYANVSPRVRTRHASMPANQHGVLRTRVLVIPAQAFRLPSPALL